MAVFGGPELLRIRSCGALGDKQLTDTQFDVSSGPKIGCRPSRGVLSLLWAAAELVWGRTVSLALSTTFGAPDGAQLQARLEGGWWRPGSVFQEPGGATPEDILGITATVEASW